MGGGGRDIAGTIADYPPVAGTPGGTRSRSARSTACDGLPVRSNGRNGRLFRCSTRSSIPTSGSAVRRSSVGSQAYPSRDPLNLLALLDSLEFEDYAGERP